MTDTGQVPGEGLPENAGMVEQPGVPAPDAYTYLSDSPAEDEDLLLPGAQGAWGNEIAPPAPEPVVETVHAPGPHEMSGRDSGSVDLSGVRPPGPAQSRTAPAAPRRPLHLGPPIPDVSASPVRSLADRGPADLPVRQAGPPTVGPEYLDIPRAREAAPQAAAPWAAQATVGAGAPAAETVGPQAEPMGAAQAVVTRVATEAEAVPGTEGAGLATGGTFAPGHAETAGVPVASEAPDTGTVPPADGTVPPADVPEYGGPDRMDQGAQVAGIPGVPPAASTVTGQEPDSGVPVTETVVSAFENSVPAPSTVPAVPDSAQEPTGLPGEETGHSAEPVPAEAAVPQAPAAALPTPGAGAVPETALAPQEPQAAPEAPRTVQETGAEGAVPGPQQVMEVPEAAQAPEEAPAAELPDAQDAAPGVPQGGEPQEAAQAGAPQAVQVPGAEELQPEAPQVMEAPESAQTPEEAPAVQVPGAPAEVPQGAETPEAVRTVEEPQAAQVPPAGAAVTADVQVPEQAQDIEVPPAAQAPGAETLAPEYDRAAEVLPVPEAVDAPAPDATEPQDARQPGVEGVAFHEVSGALWDAAPSGAVVPDPEPGPEPTTVLTAAETAEETAEETAAETAAATATATAGQPAVDRVTPESDGTVTAPADGEALAPTSPPHQAPAAGGPETSGAPDGTAWTGTAPAPADPVQGPQQTPATPLPGSFPLVPGPEQSPGRILPGPAAPQDVTVPAGEPHGAGADAVPSAPGPELAQDPADLDTQGAGVDPEAAPPTGPAAPGYDDAEREAVLKVMRERRDIRNGFRSDPIPHEVLLRVLEAAHTAPSVGHSQPWDFVVIRSAETRRGMHELAMRQRDAYAKSLPKGRAKQFKQMKIEAILDTPVNIVVTADPTRGGRHTLGRHTQPQMAPYSSALAVENLWLAARAEGLGVGWVSFFDEREMVRALGLPDHLEVVAYLCVGYVDEFPDEPELTRAGWSKRRPLSWVVHEETYGRRALPGEDPHDLLAETVAQIRPLDAKALGEAWERQKRMTKPAGALGMLEIISAQLSGLSRQCPPPIPEPAAVAIFAGDHGVHAQGVTPWPQEVTAQMVANFLGGGAVCNAFAAQVGAEVCVVDVGVSSDLPATPGLLPRKIRTGTSDMTTGPAMTREEAKQAIEVGIETARDLVAAGNKALLTGEMGIANTTASAALISVFTGADPAEVTGRGTGINDETLVRKTDVVRRALELHQPDPADPIGVLAAVGGFEHAAIVGLLLGGASLRTPVILDGVSAGAAALVARAIAPEVLAACIAGHRSAEPGHVAALNKLGLRPLVDLDLRLGEGTGALLALPLVQSTARAMHEVATFDSAGVTEK
ncbi:nicotinate-nucleotide--dimethylbenzimidazole phosphoribosyltransferase [Streptomyces sp. NPDC001273]|uniref:nicotinate-nucleotide--dimethylbenzimidazole phosphoribosyltransferase n=1 Tax=unclassified Streptomyces TaxID=2593676 RepID=UPI0033EBF0EC